MKILAFDTSNASLSAAFLEDEKLLQIINIEESDRQSELLILTLEKILKNAAIWYQDLDLIAVTKGPGSFTGIRVGMACAKSLQIATNLPIVAVDSLEVLAYKYLTTANKIRVLIDARGNEFFSADFFSSGQKLEITRESRLIELEEFQTLSSNKEFFLCGNAVNKDDKISADLVGRLAYQKFLAGDFSDDASLSYLRDPRITQRKK